MTDEPTAGVLEACPWCGKECRVEVFTGEHIDGEVCLWFCSDNKYVGGGCVDPNVYLSESAWNTHHSPDRLAELAEALEPFAACCDYIKDDEDDEEWAKFRLIVSDYRRARAALARWKEQGGG